MVTHAFVNGSRDKGNEDEEQNSNHRNEHSEAVLEPRAAVDKPTIYSQLTAGENALAFPAGLKFSNRYQPLPDTYDEVKTPQP